MAPKRPDSAPEMAGIRMELRAGTALHSCLLTAPLTGEVPELDALVGEIGVGDGGFPLDQVPGDPDLAPEVEGVDGDDHVTGTTTRHSTSNRLMQRPMS